MILKFATKRDINGNRMFFAIDTSKKQYTDNNAHWFCREEIIEVSKTDLRKIRMECVYNEQWKYIESL